MRYTLSVITAACLLALGQSAWSACWDTELQKRARIAALALPAVDRSSAALLLEQLQIPSTAAQHALALNPLANAAQHSLQNSYGTQLTHHQRPVVHVALGWSKSLLQELSTHYTMELETRLVQKWTQALHDLHAT